MVARTEIGVDDVVAQAKGLVAADMDGDKVMLHIEQGKYFGLNGIGSHIWEIIEQPHTVQEVVRLLLEEYDVEEKACQHDVLTFLGALYAKGLVDIA